MSLSGALTVALSGLQASTTAVQIVSGNVTNAQTEGYTKKSISLSAVSTGTSQGGVEITNYTRATNTVLSATLNSATSNASYYSTQSTYLNQVQTILDSTGDPPALSNYLSEFQSAWTEFSANPSDTTLEQSVITSGQLFANEINSIASQTESLRVSIQSTLEANVSELNTALSDLQTLNTEISTALSNNRPTVDLEDERDTLINKISQYTNVTVMERDNDQIALYTSGGTALLDGAAQTFSVGSDGNSVVNASGSDVTSSLTRGSLQAMTDFLSENVTSANGVAVLTKLESQMKNFANIFIATTGDGNSFADVYKSADTDTGELDDEFFTALIGSDGLPDISSFAVNSDLIDGTSKVKKDAGTGISDMMLDTDIAITTTLSGGSYIYSTSSTFSASGLTVKSQTASGIATAILTGFQQAASATKSQYATASTQQAYYKSSLSSETGVDTDTELVNLTMWENSYAASAHVISTIQSMMQTLEDMVG